MEIMGRKLSVAAAVATLLLVIGGSEALELCNMKEDGLNACKPTVTQPNPVDPTPPCCEALSGADLTCLCGYKCYPGQTSPEFWVVRSDSFGCLTV
ncbi:hypothetical protein RHMOL_Rhmol07G0301700 [Rhododendron molle]|uniref:Uncharacterized protein n=1 Tax=Rhododendron molle TaxID=49168 RepID=A0ACC0N7D1_RHOML|nr:hypothetical protein RHMOL_Rhmol07G0301700 [Rhododendron molle]